MISLDSAALAVHIVSCVFMAGVISVVQLIHYPCFVQIDKAQFSNFHLRHTRALGWIAGPAMCAELISAIWIARSGNLFLILNLVSVITIWILTFSISVPSHKRLAMGFNETAWRRLLGTNWLRSFLWCSRALLFLISLVFLLGHLP